MSKDERKKNVCVWRAGEGQPKRSTPFSFPPTKQQPTTTIKSTLYNNIYNHG